MPTLTEAQALCEWLVVIGLLALAALAIVVWVELDPDKENGRE